MRKKIIWIIFLFLVFGFRTRTVHASGVVGDGTPGSCTEAAFDTALSSGGTITFDCGAGPHTIILTSQKSINHDTTSDGGALITLSGGNSVRLFDVGATLILKDIVLTNGYFNGDGGAIRNNANGTLALDHVTIQNSTATLSGGAIVSYGPLNILDSTLSGNTAYNGGALYLRLSGSQTNIVNSILENNKAEGNYPDGWGGAILLWDGAAATIQGSTINSNSAKDGAGIFTTTNTSLILEDSNVSANLADTQYGQGGGIANYGTVTLNRVTFSENRSGLSGGGGLQNVDGLAFLTDVTFSNNSATALQGGGGLGNEGGTVYLTNVTFSGNHGDFYGGGMADQHGLTSMWNVTFSNNVSGYGGGLYVQDSIVNLTSVTFDGNSGGGIYYDLVDPAANISLKNTIVANSNDGSDCGGNVNNGFTSLGFNLSSDGSCPFQQLTDQTNVDPLLGPLGPNGGYTWTHVPQKGSPAIDKGQCLAQNPTDQRGVARPQGPACDIGAVEVEVLRNYLVYLPMVVR